MNPTNQPMKHSFKLKKADLKSVFSEKLNINHVSIENKSDVHNLITSLLNYIELEDYLTPKNCTYNFFNNIITFELELEDSKEKQDFFDSIKKFESLLEI